MFLYGMKLYVFKHLILCSNFSTFKYNDSVDTNIYLQAHGAYINNTTVGHTPLYGDQCGYNELRFWEAS